MKLNQEQKEQLAQMSSDHRKLIEFLLDGFCKLQEESVLKQPAMDEKRLSYEMARLEGARKLAVEFRRLIAIEPRK